MFTRQTMMMTTATALAVVLSTALTAAQNDKSSKDDDAKRPKIRLRVQPQVVIAPARVTLTAELTGTTGSTFTGAVVQERQPLPMAG